MADRITGSVLDAGCGTGENALFFASRGQTVTGVDFLAEPITLAKQKAAGPTGRGRTPPPGTRPPRRRAAHGCGPRPTRPAGGAGTDALTSGAGGDVPRGGGAADRLFGNAGGDTLEGGDGGDFLSGGGDDDVLFGQFVFNLGGPVPDDPWALQTPDGEDDRLDGSADDVSTSGSAAGNDASVARLTGGTGSAEFVRYGRIDWLVPFASLDENADHNPPFDFDAGANVSLPTL